MERFGLDPADVHPPANIVRPKDEGKIALEKRKLSQLRPSGDPEAWAKAFLREYRGQAAYLEDSSAAAGERARRTLSLFRDYATALWAGGETSYTEQIGTALLDAFAETRSGKLAGSKNYNGAPWSAAQSLMLGLDPNEFASHFPDAR